MGNQNSSDFLSACGLSRFLTLQMVIRAAIELKVFDILSNPKPGTLLSVVEIVSHMTTTNPEATVVALERILRMLAINSILSTALRPSPSEANPAGQERVYGLTGESRYLATDASGVSLTDYFLLVTDKSLVKQLYLLKEAVLEPDAFAGGSRSFFDLLSEDEELGRIFNGFLSMCSEVFLDEVVGVYRGFDDVSELMDVGGCTGTTLGKIIAVHPHIRGINFDLPHVIAKAPDIPGVKHVSRDMFETLPNAQTITMKFILHDWDDDRCKTLLRNCWKALPENGKVIVMEFAIPEVLESNVETHYLLSMDVQMLTLNPGGKERTVAEFVALAKASGFAGTNVCPISRGIHVLEFLKNN